MSLITRCPKCHSDFVVKLDQLQAQDGLVRCGSCARIFDGYSTLQSELPTLTQRSDSSVPLRTRSAIAAAMPAPIPAPTLAPTPTSIPAPIVAPIFPASTTSSEPQFFGDERLTAESDFSIQGESRLRGEGVSTGRTQPEFLVDEVDTKTLKTLLWGLASAMAVATLVLQLAYVFRNDLATYVPSVRPALDALCATFKCDVSMRRYLERISVSVIAFEKSAVQGNEGAPSPLVLKFSMRNRLNQAQPWPHLSLELTDASSTVVLRKSLSPKDYLPKSLADTPFMAGQELSLDLPITVTGLVINGYTIKPFFP